MNQGRERRTQSRQRRSKDAGRQASHRFVGEPADVLVSNVCRRQALARPGLDYGLIRAGGSRMIHFGGETKLLNDMT
jgi:hypothetical protein